MKFLFLSCFFLFFILMGFFFTIDSGYRGNIVVFFQTYQPDTLSRSAHFSQAVHSHPYCNTVFRNYYQVIQISHRLNSNQLASFFGNLYCRNAFPPLLVTR